MQAIDIGVIVLYLLALAGLGGWAARRSRDPDEYFLGHGSFGKVLQSFGVFASGIPSGNPLRTGLTTFAQGLAGTWVTLHWLFVTPFYWLLAPWYRRMRHRTLADWFVERYESPLLGAAYALFGTIFVVAISTMLLSVLASLAAPLVGRTELLVAGTSLPTEQVVLIGFGTVVLLYVVLGGLRATYYAGLLQGACLVLLTGLLIGLGFRLLAARFGGAELTSMLDGFRILHQRLGPEYFELLNSSAFADFPPHRILTLVVLNIVGVVVQPQMIAIGGGSADSELTARSGLVIGDLTRRLCVVGWALFALIAFALFADQPEMIWAPQQMWGRAAREVLGPGLTGLLVVTLVAGIMNYVGLLAVIGSALVVQNLYVPYLARAASARWQVGAGRLVAGGLIVLAIALALAVPQYFRLLQLTWVSAVAFAAPFWTGMLWRRATSAAAWTTVVFCSLLFVILPAALPRLVPALRTEPRLLLANRMVRTTTYRAATASDAARVNPQRERELQVWQQRLAEAQGIEHDVERLDALVELGPRPEMLKPGDRFGFHEYRGGQAIFWTGGLRPVDAEGRPIEVEPAARGAVRPLDESAEEVELAYARHVLLEGRGRLRLDFLFYHILGLPLQSMSDATLETLNLPLKILVPLLLMIIVSLVTEPNSDDVLDRFYAKMKTEVHPDPEIDAQLLEEANHYPTLLEDQKLLPHSPYELLRPTPFDLLGFTLTLAASLLILVLAVGLTRIGV